MLWLKKRREKLWFDRWKIVLLPYLKVPREIYGKLLGIQGEIFRQIDHSAFPPL